MPATASRSACEGSRRGFTLLEVLITIALIALLAGVLVVGTNRLLRSKPLSADELFWVAANATRKEALLNNRDVRLRFDAKAREFISLSSGGETRYPFVVKETAELDFLVPKSAGNGSAMLIGGDLVETQTLPAVTFYGDGTCSPFRVQFKTPAGTRVQEIDPWTCAPMLKAEAPR